MNFIPFVDMENFFTLYKFDTIIENGFKVIVPYFEEHIIN